MLFATSAFAADGDKPGFFEKLAPIAILLVVVTFVISRLPKVEGINHSAAFERRRVFNWLPLGLTYAFLYMGRYNLKVSKFAFENMQGADGGAMMGNDDFGFIFGVGTIVYGCSFLINGPLTDRMGGKFSILMGAGGSMVMNLIMGLCSLSLLHAGPMHEAIAGNFRILFSVLYGINMYFQSFGAVAIVKVNAPWFHVRERGVFGAIFGILISLGVYFAFDLGYLILNSWGLEWVFLTPAVLLALFWVIDFFVVKNTPGDAGLLDFDTADASSGDDGPRLPAMQVFKMMLTNPIILTIAGIEFCSGFLRQAIMQWYRTFAKQTDIALHLKGDFVYENWGMLLCCAGILGGVTAGIISDRVFQSRRGPVAFILYAVMLLGSISLVFLYDTPYVGWLVVFMSMAVIGVHGMLSGTASMDFGGKKNVGVAVGIIDGFVYLGTAVMSFTYGAILPKEELSDAGELVGAVTDPANWIGWPVAMIPFALVGALLATRVWNAKPKGKGGGH
ncbi:MAG: MFS transporter [Deltaproteobacteria bacterium]|nr:MFS transporter [Deltaproteobacteria bacterium]